MKRMTWDKEEEIRSNVIIIEWIVEHGRSCARNALLLPTN